MDLTEAALLRAIAAHPDEDTPRLVYADYLDELGGASAVARAEFIRLHVRAAGLRRDASEFEPVFRRIDQLICAWDVAWQTELPDGCKRLCGYRRGFPYRAAANASALTAAADDPRMLTVEYLELMVDTSPRQLRKLTKLPLFAQLTELVVRGGPLVWSGARALADGEFPRLRRLALARQSIGDIGLRAIIDSGTFPRLRELDISYNGIQAAALAEFRRSHLGARLERLNDQGNEPP